MHPGGPSAPGDPNAAFHFDGTYHLHYILRHDWQGQRSFSFVHVTSPDMLHWEWQPTKLQPDFTGHGMYSGTGFLAHDGTPSIIYHGEGSGKNWITQATNRQLSAWAKPYSLDIEDAPEDMRQWDPDCFLIGETYYAISGGKDPPLFKSDDLRTWVYVGPFLSHEPDNVALGEDISCANFFPIDDPSIGNQRWMLLCISHTHGCRFYLGDWDANREQFVPEKHTRLNWPQEGQQPVLQRDLRTWDLFAPESVLTPDGRRVIWAWMHSLNPALREKSIQSLPREIRLDDTGTLRIRPLQELETLRHNPHILRDFAIAPEEKNFGGSVTRRIFTMDDDAWEIRAVIPREQAHRKRFGLLVYADGTQSGLPITFQPAYGTIRVGKTEAPFAVADLPPDEDIELRVFIDRYLVEVFVNDRLALVAADLEGHHARGVDAFAWGNPITFDTIEIWRIKSTQEGYLEAREKPVWKPNPGGPAPTATSQIVPSSE
ncbi:MAG: glycoside hydrolase family 32 protein [Verrucomicrobiota bacterium]